MYEVAQEATTTAINIVQLRERHRNIIAATHSSRSAGPAYQLLEYLYEKPIITVNNVTKVTGLSYTNANKLVTNFQEHGLLRQMDKYQRNRRFEYSDYLKLFMNEEILTSDYQMPSTFQEDEKGTS